MRRFVVAVAACSALGAWGQSGDSNKPRFEYVDDGAGKFEGARFYERLEPSPPSPPKRTLGTIDTWRYESCQTDAAKAPTSQGVFQGMRVCREKFGQ